MRRRGHTRPAPATVLSYLRVHTLETNLLFEFGAHRVVPNSVIQEAYVVVVASRPIGREQAFHPEKVVTPGVFSNRWTNYIAMRVVISSNFSVKNNPVVESKPFPRTKITARLANDGFSTSEKLVSYGFKLLNTAASK